MRDREPHLRGYTHAEVIDSRTLTLMQEAGNRHGFNIEVVASEGEKWQSYESLTGRQQPLLGDCRGSHHLTISAKDFPDFANIPEDHVQVLITSEHFDPSAFWTDFTEGIGDVLQNSKN